MRFVLPPSNLLKRFQKDGVGRRQVLNEGLRVNELVEKWEEDLKLNVIYLMSVNTI